MFPLMAANRHLPFSHNLSINPPVRHSFRSSFYTQYAALPDILLGSVAGMAEVGKLFGVSWNTVRSAVEGAVAYGREQEDYKGVRHIGIDEISRKKGHVYHTNMYDLDGRRLLWGGAH